MKVTISARAEKQLERLPKVKQIIVAAKIRSLTGGEQLRGYKDVFRVRVGDYRIVYRKSSDGLYAILIGNRKEIYKLLEQL